MSQLKKRDIQTALARMGFVARHGHHIFYDHYTIAKIKSEVRTYMSHGSKPKSLGDALINKMAKQIYLNRSQFIDFVNGKMSREEYEEILRAKNILPPKL